MTTEASTNRSNPKNSLLWLAFFLYAVSSIASFAIGLDCAIIVIHWMNLYSMTAGLPVLIGLCAISGLALNWILYQADAFEALCDFCLGIKQHCTKKNLILLLVASLIVTTTVMFLVVPHVAFLSTLTGITRFTACTTLILSGIIVIEACMRLMTSSLSPTASTTWKQCLAAICSNIIPFASAVCMGLFTYHAYALNPVITLSMPYIIIFSLAYAIGTFTLMRRSIAKLMISFSHQDLLTKVKQHLTNPNEPASLSEIQTALSSTRNVQLERNLAQLLSREDLFAFNQNTQKYSLNSSIQTNNHPLKSWGLGLVPIVLFFTTYLAFGLSIATLVCALISTLQIGYIYSKKDRADTTQKNIILSTPFILAILGTAVCWKDGVLHAFSLLHIAPAVAAPLTYLFISAMVIAEIFFCIDLTRKILIQLETPAQGEDQSMSKAILSKFTKNFSTFLCSLLILIPIGLNGFANGIIAVSDPITFAQFGFPLLLLGVLLSFSIMTNETSGLKSTALWPDKLLPLLSDRTHAERNQIEQNQLSPQHRRIFFIISIVAPLSVMTFYFDQNVGVTLLNTALSAAHLSTALSIPIAAALSLVTLLLVGGILQCVANKYDMFDPQPVKGGQLAIMPTNSRGSSQQGHLMQPPQQPTEVSDAAAAAKQPTEASDADSARDFRIN